MANPPEFSGNGNGDDAEMKRPGPFDKDGNVDDYFGWFGEPAEHPDDLAPRDENPEDRPPRPDA